MQIRGFSLCCKPVLDTIIYLLALVALLGLAGIMLYMGIVALFYQLEASSIQAGGGNAWKRLYRPRKLPVHQLSTLHQKFGYYKRLPANYQQRFETRMVHVLRKLRFEGRDGMVVTEEMRILVAACLVKLTFGYRLYHITGFNRVILYPEAFYSRFTQSMNKGETHAAGFVVLSWKDTLAGLAIEDDNLHLVLHEFAHALYLSHMREQGVDQRFSLHWPMWLKYVQHIGNMNKLRADGFFRAYAFTNQAELFACMVESFFESPVKFNEKHPVLFRIMSLLLNQHPLKMK